ncbi:MAG: lipopolysaccharide transport periplasmic protein LptA [Methylococcus sp.]|nr:lipopolysaccharide transport periplasmic protein LptA [Methylococcus sp.]
MTCARRAPIGIIALVCLWPSLSFGLSSDAKQPIYIEADTATYDEATGQTIYIGHVRSTQGSLIVDSDKMIVFQKGGKTEKVVATANPVRLKQTPDGGKEDIHGTGQRAEFFPETGILILYDKAVVWQGGDSTESDRIEYDSHKNFVKAGDPQSNKSRVHVKLAPKVETGTPK